jgi:hypothetical protein
MHTWHVRDMMQISGNFRLLHSRRRGGRFFARPAARAAAPPTSSRTCQIFCSFYVFSVFIDPVSTRRRLSKQRVARLRGAACSLRI